VRNTHKCTRCTRPAAAAAVTAAAAARAPDCRTATAPAAAASAGGGFARCSRRRQARRLPQPQTRTMCLWGGWRREWHRCLERASAWRAAMGTRCAAGERRTRDTLSRAARPGGQATPPVAVPAVCGACVRSRGGRMKERRSKSHGRRAGACLRVIHECRALLACWPRVRRASWPSPVMQRRYWCLQQTVSAFVTLQLEASNTKSAQREPRVEREALRRPATTLTALALGRERCSAEQAGQARRSPCAR